MCCVESYVKIWFSYIEYVEYVSVIGIFSKI